MRGALPGLPHKAFTHSWFRLPSRGQQPVATIVELRMEERQEVGPQPACYFRMDRSGDATMRRPRRTLRQVTVGLVEVGNADARTCSVLWLGARRLTERRRLVFSGGRPVCKSSGACPVLVGLLSDLPIVSPKQALRVLTRRDVRHVRPAAMPSALKVAAAVFADSARAGDACHGSSSGRRRLLCVEVGTPFGRAEGLVDHSSLDP